MLTGVSQGSHLPDAPRHSCCAHSSGLKSQSSGDLATPHKLSDVCPQSQPLRIKLWGPSPPTQFLGLQTVGEA